MIVKSLELMNFRNYEKLSVDFDPSTNIIYGNNAQGKTNILEAIYLSGTSRSHRGSRDREMIRFGTDEAHIRTLILKNSDEYRIDIHLRKNSSKGIAINKIPVHKTSELFGILNVIFFSPEDLTIIKSGPDRRRRFIDMELCQTDRVYLYNLTEYNKALNQRNRLLKDIKYDGRLSDTLSVWDDALAEYGSKVIRRREEFVEEIAPVVKEIHGQISGDNEEVKLTYEKNVSADDFRKALDIAYDNDMRLGSTTKGPHRDDLGFSLKGTDLRKYGSQGQQRTAALSLKLSEVTVMEKKTGEKPVLLLDDVLSELDSTRQKDLLESLTDTQTIITCTGLDEFVKSRYRVNRIFEVVNGSVTLGKNSPDTLE